MTAVLETAVVVVFVAIFAVLAVLGLRANAKQVEKDLEAMRQRKRA